MAGKNKKKKSGNDIAVNRRARFDYFIEDTIEAGIMLTGTEVKSCREGHASIAEAYAGEGNGALVLFNAHIQEYNHAGRHLQHEPRRPRRLLVHNKEMHKLLADIARQGVTLVPMRMYFSDRGLVKIELGLATGKKKGDKRETEKKRDWQRDKARLMRAKG